MVVLQPVGQPRPSKAAVKEPPGNKPPAAKEPPSTDPSVKEPKHIDTQCEQEPQLDEVERFLVLLFLRRYFTYCARRARSAQMNGAAELHRKIACPS